jgi:hypothetical protein
MGKAQRNNFTHYNVPLSETYILRLNSAGSEQGQMAGFCEYGNEHFGSIKAVSFSTRQTVKLQALRETLNEVNKSFNIIFFLQNDFDWLEILIHTENTNALLSEVIKLNVTW